jgi:hypothetical protein
MNYGAYQKNLPPLKRNDPYRTEIHRRAALPFHQTGGATAGHDLLVMNPYPDLACQAEATPVPNWARPAD